VDVFVIQASEKPAHKQTIVVDRTTCLRTIEQLRMLSAW
jgi:hypothetical protein